MNDGYLFFRDILPKEKVYTLRRKIMEFCQDAGWLRSNSDPMEGLTDREPILEGEAEWRPVYAKLKALESFHSLKLTDRVYSIIESLFQEPVFALPKDNERGTQPHQDWLKLWWHPKHFLVGVL